jgi:hypothetical protein
VCYFRNINWKSTPSTHEQNPLERGSVIGMNRELPAGADSFDARSMASIRSRKISASIVVFPSSRACPNALSAAVGGGFKDEHCAPKSAKGIFCDGGLVSSAFRLLRRSGVGCSLAGASLLFGIGTWALPRWDQEDAADQSLDHKDSKRTRLIHRPCRDIAPPVGGIRVFSCRVSIVYDSL